MFRNRTFADRVEPADWPDFTKNVNDYVSAVDAIDKGLPQVSAQATAAQVVAHQQALAKAIQSSRKTARRGDIFSSAISKRFIKLVRSEVRGAAGKSSRTIIREDNPATPGNGPPVTLAVNRLYPDGPPLSTMPPTLLLRMPVLPKGVEFRFVGKALVLRDVRANTIVDWIPRTLP
jgi:hypothetical protein